MIHRLRHYFTNRWVHWVDSCLIQELLEDSNMITVMVFKHFS
jgi:hypothetical protein